MFSISMLSILYWILLSLLIIVLSHNLYSHVYASPLPSQKVCQNADRAEAAMREELTAYIKTIQK